MRHSGTILPKAAICTAVLAAALQAPAAGPVLYDNEGDAIEWWGTGKKETYDVAAYIGPSLKGAQIRKITFHAADDPEVSGFSIWLSEALTLEEEKFVPGVTSAPVEQADGRISLTLQEPYTVGDAGVYIGYTFTVSQRETEAQKNPVAVTSGGTDIHGLYVHSSRTYTKWLPSAAGENLYLPFEMELSGLPEHAVELRLPAEINAAVDSEIVVDATLANYGSSEVSAVEVEWKSGENGGKIPVTLATPLPSEFMATAPLLIRLPALASAGEYDLTMKVSTVDGVGNVYAGEDAKSVIKVWKWLPKRTPLLEEYTGTGCGYCPRGAIGMEKMEALHGEDFVGVAYHHGDVMSILSPEQYPNPAPAQPVAWLDRTVETDNYFGNLPITSKKFGFDEVWTREAARFTPAEVSMTCDWTNSTHKVIKIQAEAKFAKAYESSDFRLSYILVANGLKGTGRPWMQGNYYSGQTGKWPEEFDWLVNAPETLEDVTYDHVAILNPAPAGIEGSVPSRIEEGQTVSHTVTFALAEAVNLADQPLAQDGATYSVVTVLLDGATGEVVNCARKSLSGTDGVAGVEADAPVAVEYRDLLGSRLSGVPEAGIYIEIRSYADGRREVRKMISAK